MDSLQEFLEASGCLRKLNDYLWAENVRSIGRSRTCSPVAAKRAAPMDGVEVVIGDSPAPAEGISRRSISMTSISGISRKRGTR